MCLREIGDSGVADDGFVYKLVWETLDANRDRPRPRPWPEPVPLRLVRGEPPR
jgi:hypothetical protein